MNSTTVQQGPELRTGGVIPREFYGLPLFKDLAAEEIDEIAALVGVAHYRPGEVIYQENGPGGGLYLLNSGSVEIRKTDACGNERVISTLYAPSVFGELSLLSGAGHSVSCLSASEVALNVLDREDFHQVVRSGRPVALKILYNLAHIAGDRLRSVNEKLLATKVTNGGHIQEFEMLREKLFKSWAF